MKTTIEIDDKILKDALEISGEKSNETLLELVLKEYVRKNNQKKLLKFRNSKIWEGNLEEMRATR